MITNKNIFLRYVVLISIFCFGLTSCSVTKNQKEKNSSLKYRLVFEDQFKGDAYNPKFWGSYQSKSGKSQIGRAHV